MADVIFHGRNGGSLPPRLPELSKILKALRGRNVAFTLAALSYRGYWTSRGSASERGIKLDAQATVAWVRENFPRAKMVLWGQSIGAGVATTTAAVDRNAGGRADSQIAGMILETPFTSIRDMLTAMYPQKWLPYRYLYPFLWSHWDTRDALTQISRRLVKPKILIVAGEQDEVVPAHHATEIKSICEDGGITINQVTVPAALHHDAAIRPQGRRAIVNFLSDISDGVT